MCKRERNQIRDEFKTSKARNATRGVLEGAIAYVISKSDKLLVSAPPKVRKTDLISRVTNCGQYQSSHVLEAAL